MVAPIIETPRGKIIITKGGKAELSWNINFRDTWQKRYSAAQVYVDNEVIRLSEKYTPLLTGTLIKSATLGSVPGSGVVSWIVPYARRQYYSPRKPGSATGPLRGPFWFERGKQVWGQQVLSGARRIAGTGNK